jgi:hypothetical protein
MKSNKEFRSNESIKEPDDAPKNLKLAPIKKSGKDKHFLYNDDDDYDDLDEGYSKRESILDYFDDEEEEF